MFLPLQHHEAVAIIEEAVRRWRDEFDSDGDSCRVVDLDAGHLKALAHDIVFHLWNWQAKATRDALHE